MKMTERQFLIEHQRIKEMRTPAVPHLIMSIITCGFWLPVWALLSLITGIQKGAALAKLERRVNEE